MRAAEFAKERLERLGREVLEEIEKGENPKIRIPVRALSNVFFDQGSMSLTLGDRFAKRFLFHAAHAKKFTQTMMVAAFCYELLREGIHTSLRDMFYALKRTFPNSNENTFDEQRESDVVVVDLEVALNVLREQLHLIADTRGRVVGNVVIKDGRDTIDWSKLGRGGWHIPSTVEDIEFREVDAEYVLVVEKNAAWERLNEDRFWEKHRCILIGVQGQAARGARRLIQRLAKEFKLPVYVLTDLDAYGLYIFSVIKYGSISLAHISDRLGTPTAKFLGLSVDDIDEYNLHNYTIKATEADIKRARELLGYEWFQRKEWQAMLKEMIRRKIKAELEALSGKGIRFISQTYIPKKIENGEFLD